MNIWMQHTGLCSQAFEHWDEISHILLVEKLQGSRKQARERQGEILGLCKQAHGKARELQVFVLIFFMVVLECLTLMHTILCKQ